MVVSEIVLLVLTNHTRGALCRKSEILPLTDAQGVIDAGHTDLGFLPREQSRGEAVRSGEPRRKEGRDG
jgi:hypothetical protein